MQIHLTRKNFGLAIAAFIALCCFVFLVYYYVGGTAKQQMRLRVMQSLHIGMSREQVIDMLSHEGMFAMYSLTPYPCGSHDNVIEVKAVYLQRDWWYPSKLLLWVCYDDSGSLIYFYQGED